MLSSMLAVSRPAFSESALSDSGSLSGFDPPPPRFPHTRAQLSAIARQYKLPDSYDSDAEGDDVPRVSAPLVARVVVLLDQEHEDEVKSLLKDTFGHIDDEAVSLCLI